MNLKHPVIRNMIPLFILRGANYIMPLVTMPYLVRVLGPEMFGKIAFAQAFIQYFVIITDFGFNLSATRSIAMNHQDKNRVSRIFNSVVLIKTMLMVLSLLAVILIVYLIPKFHADRDIYLLSFLAVIGSVLFPLWFFQGMQEMSYIAKLSIIAQGVSAACVFMFVHRPSDYLLVVTLQSGAMILAGLMAIRPVHRILPIQFKLPTIAELKETLEEGWYIFVLAGATQVYATSNIFILGLMTNPVLVAYFSIAYKLLNAIARLMTPLYNAIYPHISMLVSQSKEKAIHFIGRSLRWVGGASLAVTFMVILTAKYLVEILFGMQYLEAIPIVQLLAFNIFLVGLGNMLGMETMLTFGFNKQYVRIVLGTLVVNLLMMVPLVYWFKMNGAALGTLLTESLVVLWMVKTLLRNGLNVWSPQKSWFSE